MSRMLKALRELEASDRLALPTAQPAPPAESSAAETGGTVEKDDAEADGQRQSADSENAVSASQRDVTTSQPESSCDQARAATDEPFEPAFVSWDDLPQAYGSELFSFGDFLHEADAKAQHEEESLASPRSEPDPAETERLAAAPREGDDVPADGEGHAVDDSPASETGGGSLETRMLSTIESADALANSDRSDNEADRMDAAEEAGRAAAGLGTTDDANLPHAAERADSDAHAADNEVHQDAASGEELEGAAPSSSATATTPIDARHLVKGDIREPSDGALDDDAKMAGETPAAAAGVGGGNDEHAVSAPERDIERDAAAAIEDPTPKPTTARATEIIPRGGFDEENQEDAGDTESAATPIDEAATSDHTSTSGEICLRAPLDFSDSRRVTEPIDTAIRESESPTAGPDITSEAPAGGLDQPEEIVDSPLPPAEAAGEIAPPDTEAPPAIVARDAESSAPPADEIHRDEVHEDRVDDNNETAASVPLEAAADAIDQPEPVDAFEEVDIDRLIGDVTDEEPSRDAAEFSEEREKPHEESGDFGVWGDVPDEAAAESTPPEDALSEQTLPEATTNAAKPATARGSEDEQTEPPTSDAADEFDAVGENQPSEEAGLEAGPDAADEDVAADADAVPRDAPFSPLAKEDRPDLSPAEAAALADLDASELFQHYLGLGNRIVKDLSKGEFASAAVVGAEHQPHVTETVIRTAMSLCLDKQQHILIVDAALNDKHLTAGLGLTAEFGLSEVIKGRVPWQQAVRATGTPGMCALPAGRITPPNLEKDDKRLTNLLKELTSQWDLVLLDAGCVGESTAPGVMYAARNVYLVVRLGETEIEAAESALEVIECSGAASRGCIVTNA